MQQAGQSKSFAVSASEPWKSEKNPRNTLLFIGEVAFKRSRLEKNTNSGKYYSKIYVSLLEQNLSPFCHYLWLFCHYPNQRKPSIYASKVSV